MAEVDQTIIEAAAEDEEAAAVQEQIRRIRAEEEEFETFDLKIIHRKNRCGHQVTERCWLLDASANCTLVPTWT